MKRAFAASLLLIATASFFGACEKNKSAPLSAAPPDAGAPDAGPPDAGVAQAAPDAGPLELTGRIAFIRERDHDDLEAVLLDLADGGMTSLTLDAGSSFPATASPDGAQLAVLTAKGVEAVHEEQLWLVRPGKKGGVKRVGPKSARVRNPVFHPNGTQVVFEAGHTSFSDLFSVGTDGKKLRRLTDNPEGNFEPHFAPDGTWIVFVSSRDKNPELYRMNVDGSNEERLTTSAYEEVSPQVSPDSMQIAFISNRDGDDRLYVMGRFGGEARRITPPAASGTPGTLTNTGESTPVWSPDGRLIAFSRREADNSQAIWVTDPNGEARMLASGKAYAMPSWSPDGRYLAFSGEAGKEGRAQLFAVEVETGRVARLVESATNDWRPVWLPEPARTK